MTLLIHGTKATAKVFSDDSNDTSDAEDTVPACEH